jgi:hypothetical protein
MDWGGWATFGFVATVLLTGILVGAQVAGLSRMDIPMMLGTVFVEDPDRARVIGTFVHLINGQIFAVLYTAAFALLGWATWWLGAIFGLIHGVAALTLILPLLPGLHPRMASDRAGPDLHAVLEPPGPLAINYGIQDARGHARRARRVRRDPRRVPQADVAFRRRVAA